MTTLTLKPGSLSYAEIKTAVTSTQKIKLDSACLEKVKASTETVEEVIKSGKTVYGINTGFGYLANTEIPESQLEQLQYNLIVSHAAGVGDLLSDEIVRLILLLKINSLSRGYSGVRLDLIKALISLFNSEVYPCIPSKGSVGASGDLAPLAHLCAPLLGIGEVRYQGKVLPAKKGLAKAGLKVMTLAPKEGLALINGTQVSTALAIAALFELEKVFCTALLAGGLSLLAGKGSDVAFDARIHEVRGQQGQQDVAKYFRQLLGKQNLNPLRVQDPYSLRCQPQVMGACLEQMRFAAKTLLTEANAVSDNPLVFSKDGDIISGGNFHAEPVAMVADNLALAAAEVGSLSERRIAFLTDSHLSNLPDFLVNESGVNSGFMLAHVTAAALVSENKSLAHPASVDSIPTSANQEDHVSMATGAARRLHTMADNAMNVVAIELLAACQGIDLDDETTVTDELAKAYDCVREQVGSYDVDRFFAPDIAKIKALIAADDFSEFLNERLF